MDTGGGGGHREVLSRGGTSQTQMEGELEGLSGGREPWDVAGVGPQVGEASSVPWRGEKMGGWETRLGGQVDELWAVQDKAQDSGGVRAFWRR